MRLRLWLLAWLCVAAAACSSASTQTASRKLADASPAPTALPVVNASGAPVASPETGASSGAPAAAGKATAKPSATAKTQQQAAKAADAPCVQRPGVEDAPATPSGPVQAGKYTFDIDGTYHLEGKQERNGKLPDTAVRVRSPATSENGGTRWSDERTGDNGGTVTSYFLQTGNVVVLDRTQTHSRRGDREFKPSPPLTFAQYPLAVGASWQSTGTDGSTTVTMKASVLRKDFAEVCGSRYGVWVIESTTKIVASQATVDTHAITWVATQLGALPLRAETDSKATAQGATLTTKGVETLRSIVPE